MRRSTILAPGHHLLLLLPLLLRAVLGGDDVCPNLHINAVWPDGYDALLSFELDHTVEGWTATLRFDRYLPVLYCWQGTVSTQDYKVWRVSNLNWDADYVEGSRVSLRIQPRYQYNAKRPNLIAAEIDGQNICGWMTTHRPSPTTTLAPTTTRVPTTTWLPTTTTTTVSNDTCLDVADIGTNYGAATEVSVSLTPTRDIQHWRVDIEFESEIVSISSRMAEITGRGASWTLSDKTFDGTIHAGQTLVLEFLVSHGVGNMPGFISIAFNQIIVCGEYVP